MDTREKVRVLLVDDEPALVRLMQTYLTRMGYAVDTSGDANGAFAAVAESTRPYDLLVADVTLPGMSGQDMALQLLADHPDLKVLLCSGYPVAVDALPEHVHSRVAALEKPFLPNMLANAIEELLQRNAK
jgi:DNA-binding NtrC family response regulator